MVIAVIAALVLGTGTALAATFLVLPARGGSDLGPAVVVDAGPAAGRIGAPAEDASRPLVSPTAPAGDDATAQPQPSPTLIVLEPSSHDLGDDHGGDSGKDSAEDSVKDSGKGSGKDSGSTSGSDDGSKSGSSGSGSDD